MIFYNSEGVLGSAHNRSDQLDIQVCLLQRGRALGGFLAFAAFRFARVGAVEDIPLGDLVVESQGLLPGHLALDVALPGAPAQIGLRGGQIGEQDRIADLGHQVREEAQEDQVLDPEVLFPHSRADVGPNCLRSLSPIS